ncbi:MAG: type 1 glutamine amidotransferase [Acidimicrobiales bacterium]
MSGPRTGPALTIAVVYPDLLGTYGDGGNGTVLVQRAAWRGFEVDLIDAVSDRPLPKADLYCLGGGEDGPQVRAAESLRSDGTLAREVASGAVVLAVCAGYQLLGRSFPDGRGRPCPGLGLLDVTTRKGRDRRAVGEAVATCDRGEPGRYQGLPLPTLTGFENHSGLTTVGRGARPLARVVVGTGNGDDERTEGAWAGRVVGSYLHGPLLARNPVLADLLLSWALGRIDGSAVELDPLDDAREGALRKERLSAAEPSFGTRPLSWAARRLLPGLRQT